MPLPLFCSKTLEEMNRKNYRRAINRLPQVKRFMNQVVESMSYNVSMFNSLEGKYFASLQAFELDVLDKSGFNEAEKKRLLQNGKIDTVTMKKLDGFLKNKGIEIPSIMTEYGQISADIANKGAKEYAKLDNIRNKAGKSPLISVIARVKGTSEGVVNDMIDRRNYLLSHEDDVQHFLGRKARDRRRERKADKRAYKLDKRRQRQDTRIARTEVKEASKTDRTAITGDVEQGAGASIASGLGGAVSGILGGGLGSIFAGGGAIPDPNDETRFMNEVTSTQAGLFGSEGGEGGLFSNGIGTKEIVALAGLSAVAFAIFKIATAKG